MTISKISTILNKYYGISNSTNRWIKLPQISTIFLDQEANIFLDNKTQIFYFNSHDETLNISQNLKYNDLESLESSVTSYPVHIKIDASKINGFISTTELGPYGTYLNRPF